MTNGNFLQVTPFLLGLIAGNFIYQAFGAELWAVAAERSLFQACAIAIYVTFFQKATP